MRLSVGLAGLLLAAAPLALAQDDLPNLSTVSQPDGQGASSTAAASSRAASTAPTSSAAAQTSVTSAATTGNFPTVTQGNGIRLSALPTLAGVGIPNQKVPDTAAAPFMHKSDLPDGTVFICVGAILGFFGASILVWRMLVAWSLHRSVKRAAQAQTMADIKTMSAVPGKKRGMYNVVGANSTMSLDHLAAAPIGKSKSSKPFAQPPGGTPPQSQSSLFFSPTANTPGVRDSIANRSSSYLPAGYYAAGNSAAAAGSPMMNVGGNLSAHNLHTPGNRFSSRSGVSPPESPSLPPSRNGYARAPPSRDGMSMYNRNSSVTLGTPGNTRSGVYGHGNDTLSQLSLNVPGGSATGGRAPSAYLEDLFENHGSGPQERY
ncbi:hypothetical protein ACN47E_002447 [Coniothyrium glycines]